LKTIVIYTENHILFQDFHLAVFSPMMDISLGQVTQSNLRKKVPVPRIAVLVVWILLALPAVALSASVEIFLQEEPETYLVIDKSEEGGDMTSGRCYCCLADEKYPGRRKAGV
jgi:hypothetical protein